MKNFAIRFTAIALALFVTVSVIPSAIELTAFAAEAAEVELDVSTAEEISVETDIETQSTSAQTEAKIEAQVEVPIVTSAEESTRESIIETKEPDTPEKANTASNKVVVKTSAYNADDNTDKGDMESQLISLKDAEVTGIINQVYTRNPIELNSVIVRINGKELRKNRDYEVRYPEDHTNVGAVTIKIVGIGSYTGEIEKTFGISYGNPAFNSITDKGNGFQIEWKAVVGAAKYKLEKKVGTGTWTQLLAGTDTSYYDPDKQANIPYTYRVTYTWENGTTSTIEQTISYSFSVGTTSITNVTSTYGGKRNFTVTFDKVIDAKGYEIRYGLNPDLSDGVVTKLGENQTTFTVSSTREGQGIYFVQVRAFAYDYSGAIVYGSWSTPRLAKFVVNDIGLTESQLEYYVSLARNNPAKKAILYALSKIGFPYSQYKRDTGSYYDCSSLAWYSWNSVGMDLTDDWIGTAAAEAEALEKSDRVVTKENLTPGCLVFWSSWYNGRYKNITHVAIYVGDGMVVEAANSRLGVVFRQMDLNGRGTLVLCANPMGKGEVPIVIPKKANTIKVKGKTAKIKYSNLRKRTQTLALKKVATVSKARGKVTYKKVSGNKKITVNKKTGKITIKKKLKKGTYKVKIKVTAAGNTKYKKGSKTVTVKIRVK